MGVLLKSIRKILVELIDRIDSGECATTDEQERMFLDLCTMIAAKERRVSKYEACRYLNMSLTLSPTLLSPIPTFPSTAPSSFSVPLLLPLNFSIPSPTNFSTPQLTYPITTTFLSTPSLPVISLALLPRHLIL